VILYKKGQGALVRWGSLLSILAMAVFGAVKLHNYLYIHTGWGSKALTTVTFPGKKLPIYVALLPAAAVVLLTGAVTVWYLNRPKVADFLIETEGELKKVSWPPRNEFVGSSIVVILVISFLSLFLFGVDEDLSKAMKWLGIGF